MWAGYGLLGGSGRVSASCLRSWPACAVWLWLEWMGEAVGFCWGEFGGGAVGWGFSPRFHGRCHAAVRIRANGAYFCCRLFCSQGKGEKPLTEGRCRGGKYNALVLLLWSFWESQWGECGVSIARSIIEKQQLFSPFG